jgi:hypothetical protein
MQGQSQLRTVGVGITALMTLLVVIGLSACSRTNRPDAKTPAPDAGVPVYPGAKALSGGFSEHLLPQDRAKLVRAVMYETEDPTPKVISFYKEALKGKTQVLETKTHGVPSAAIRVEVNGQYKLLVITANEDSGKTEIVIGNIQNPPAAK